MRYRILLSIAALWTGGATLAAELTPAEVTAAVTTWVRYVTADARPDAEIIALEPYVVDDRPAAYVAILSTGGFALCGADDQLLPVYLYSAEEPYDPTDPVNQDILAEIGGRLLAFDAALAARDPILDEYAAGLAERAAVWQDLASGSIPPAHITRSTPSAMQLPVTDTWRQGAPYNEYCPLLSAERGERTIVGCVATAMSEIMYYWKWPSTGQGTGSTTYTPRYTNDWLSTPLANGPNIPTDWAGGGRLRYNTTTHTLEMNDIWDGSIYYDGARHLSDDPNGDADPDYMDALANLWDRMIEIPHELTVDFSTSTYDWSQITDTHTTPYGPEDEQVAWLCYSVSVAVEMAHGVWASSSNTVRAADAYSDHFRYDPAAMVCTSDAAVIINEIQWLRPVQMAGSSSAGGHSFVACGYNDTVSPPQFLINKGWGGGATSWLTLDSFFPNGQSHVIYIAPLSVRFVGSASSGDGGPDAPYATLGAAFDNAPDGTTLILKAATGYWLSASEAVLDRPMTIKGYYVAIAREPTP